MKGESLKRLLALGLVCCFLVSGCSQEWRRKFMRKRKNVSPPQAVLVLQSDVQATHPPEVRYQEHFAYWKSWHSELINSLGQIRKRDMAYLNGCIGELRSLAQLLSGPPAERLRKILEELGDLQQKWEAQPSTGYATSTVRSRLDQLQREINRDFYYSKVKKWIPSGSTGKS